MQLSIPMLSTFDENEYQIQQLEGTIHYVYNYCIIKVLSYYR